MGTKLKDIAFHKYGEKLSMKSQRPRYEDQITKDDILAVLATLGVVALLLVLMSI